MAVPKRKTSRSRRDKRRTQHGRVCPNCKTYKGRDVEPIRIDAP
jgi:ribosomal protein L32